MLAELVFPVTLKHSADMYPDSPASPPWGLMLYFSLGKQLCAGFTCLTPLPASSRSLSPTGLQCLRWPYLKTPMFVPIMHQVSGHLVVHMGVCWLARCCFLCLATPERRTMVQLVYHHISSPWNITGAACSPRALMQGRTCFNSDANKNLPSSLRMLWGWQGKHTAPLQKLWQVGVRTGGRAVMVRRGQAE